MVRTPRIYWIGMAVGLAAGGMAGVWHEHSSMLRAEEDVKAKLAKAFPEAQVARLLETAERFAFGQASAEAVQQELTPQVTDKLSTIGYSDPERLASPYVGYRDQRLPVALVFALPGALLGLAAAGMFEKRTPAPAPSGVSRDAMDA